MLGHDLAPRFSFGIFHRPGRPLAEVLATDPVAYRAIAEQNSITAYVSVAATIIVLWDWVIHLEDEVEHVWKQRSTASGKPLYLFVRYAGTAFQIFGGIVHLRGWNASFCTAFYFVDPIGTAVMLSVLDLLLGYRVLCLYRMKRSLVIFNVIFYLICLVLFAVTVGLGYHGFGGIDTPRGMTGCFCTIGSWLVFMSCVPGLLFEMWIFGLALYQVAAYSKATRRGLPGALRLLLKDSISWFFIIAVMIIWNAVSLVAAPTGSHTIAIAPFHTAMIVCGCRIIIRMRKGEAQGDDSLITTDDSGVAHTQNDDVSEWSHDLPDHQSFDDSRKKLGDCGAGEGNVIHRMAAATTSLRHEPSNQDQRFVIRAESRKRSSWSDEVAARRFVGIAQKLGLPPPLSSDFNALWHEPQSFSDLEEDFSMEESLRMQRLNVSRRIAVVPEPRQPHLIGPGSGVPPGHSDTSQERRFDAIELPDEDEAIVFSRPVNPYTPKGSPCTPQIT